MTSSHELQLDCVWSSVTDIQYIHKPFHALLLLSLCFSHALPWKYANVAADNSHLRWRVILWGSLVLWHDRLWLAQLSRKEGYSFSKWHAPRSKMAWKSGCFSFSQKTRLRLTEKLYTELSTAALLPQTATGPHKHLIVTQPHDIALPWVLIKHCACIHPCHMQLKQSSCAYGKKTDLDTSSILMSEILTEC